MMTRNTEPKNAVHTVQRESVSELGQDMSATRHSS